jgi:hypothetical protein
MWFADENGQASANSETIYMKSGTMASQIVTGFFTMKGNPSTVTLAYDQSKNYSEITTSTTTTSPGPRMTTGCRLNGSSSSRAGGRHMRLQRCRGGRGTAGRRADDA